MKASQAVSSADFRSVCGVFNSL